MVGDIEDLRGFVCKAYKNISRQLTLHFTCACYLMGFEQTRACVAAERTVGRFKQSVRAEWIAQSRSH
jgi:hypothetical protein